MSNFKEVVKESIEKGIILDSCGEVERFYDYGRYIDLCGLNPKDIVENMQNAGTGGGGSSKTNVIINGVVTEENGEYYVVLNATSAVLDMITISMIIDGKTQTVTMQPDSVEAKFGPVEKYCEIENITVTPQSTSVAKYSANVVNPNGKGLFNVSVIKVIDNEETLISTEQYKYKNIVKITASDIEGYNFINWDNGIESGDTINIEFEMPEHDVEVKCYYNIKTFTITWLDDDNTELASTTVNYGDTPEYPNDNPSKVSTEKYNYTFKGWTPSITEVKEDKTYTAEYTSEIRKYEILFLNEDGTELLRTDVEYDTMPSYNGTPTKESTQQYDYTFSGWSPEITEVKGTATYTAQYTSQIRQYNITFIVGNDEVIVPVNYGDTPEYPNGTPTKESTQQYNYEFTGWSPVITTVEGEKTYTANFDEILRIYTITFLDSNGEVLQATDVPYGTLPSYDGEDPTKEQTDEFTYTFTGWDPEITTVKDTVEYRPKFKEEKRKYNIKFVNEDGTVLQATDILYGTTPDYTGETPTKEGNAEFSYEFTGWIPDITTVTGDAIYTAQFEEITNTYTVKWFNSDGSLLETDTNVDYGTLPSYDGETPTIEKEHYICDFTGWDKPINEGITGNTVYTAIYSETPIQYELNVIVKNGQYEIEPQKETYTYNEEVTITIIPNEGYQYEELTDKIRITGNMTLTYECTPIKYDLTVNDSYKGQQPYGTDISEYLTFEPQEGTTHKWMEGNEEFTGNTMPNRDLILTSKYIDITTNSKTIYYGTVKSNETTTISSNDIQNLEHYDYIDGETKDVIFMLPIRPDLWEEYYSYEDEGNTEEMLEWEKRNNYDYFIAAPSNVSVELRTGINTIKDIEAHDTININGVEYTKYYTDLGLVAEEEQSATIKMSIKIN